MMIKENVHKSWYIPHICHGPTGQARGEKSVMWRNFKFLYMTDVEKSKIHPHVD